MLGICCLPVLQTGRFESVKSERCLQPFLPRAGGSWGHVGPAGAFDFETWNVLTLRR